MTYQPGTIVMDATGLLHTIIAPNGTGLIVSVTNPGRHCEIHIGVITERVAPVPVEKKPQRSCRECGGRHFSKDLCQKHYNQIWRHGVLDRERIGVRV